MDEILPSSLQHNTKKYNIKIITTLLQTLKIHHFSTYQHSLNVARLSAWLARKIGLPQSEIFEIALGALIHDIGKIKIDTSILDKPGKLNEREFDIIKQHPYYTRLCLQEIKGFEDITEWASNHHEKINGTGYPFGKSGQELDFNSRLIGSLDVYQALMEERPYRKAMTHKQAVKILDEMTRDGMLDQRITNDIKKVFK